MTAQLGRTVFLLDPLRKNIDEKIHLGVQKDNGIDQRTDSFVGWYEPFDTYQPNTSPQ